ncbi:hypothetical protein GCM10023191_070700 [Actinoallomurus oryzae]|uniref:Uncharacterized protein n=1 Tax=Actinoallomurus oryzae TaxID=502180 RepID=A0ABP8QSW9_9ACTN
MLFVRDDQSADRAGVRRDGEGRRQAHGEGAWQAQPRGTGEMVFAGAAHKSSGLAAARARLGKEQVKSCCEKPHAS